MKKVMMLGLMILAALLPYAGAQEVSTGTKDGRPYLDTSDQFTKGATVLAVDAKTRTVTLKTTTGDKTKMVCGDAVKNFAQIEVNDVVKITYTEKLTKKVLTVELPEQEVPIPPQEIKQPKGRFIWPVEGNIVGHYGVTSGMKYDGIDIAAPLGTAVKASDAGKVAFANTILGYGNIIIIKHSDKYSTVYAHNHRNLVQEGKYVGQGAIIARLGNSHNAAASPTLHFQIRRYNKARNPLFYLR